MIKVKLSEICDLQNGYAFKSSDYVENSNTLSCRMSNIRLGGIFDIEYNPRFLPDSFADQYKGFLLKDGDLVIAMTDLANDPKLLGVPTLVQTDGRNILLNQRVGKLIIKDSSKVDNKYLQHVLNDPKTREYYKKFASGGLQINLGKSDLLNVEIPLPPLEEQRRIASILDQADELRQKRSQAIEKLDQLLQAEFINKFHQKNYPEFNVSDLLENEKSMRTGPFGSQLLHSEFVDEGIHVLGIDNAVQNSFNWAKPRFITEEKYKFLKRYTVKPKDVIITIMGTCGKCAVVPDDIPIAINTKHLCCITLDQTKCNPEFLHSYFLLHPTARNYLESRAKGAIMSGLNMGIIKELPVELPPIKIQNEFSNLKQKIILQKTLMIKELSKLNELFTSLQIQAFSGTL